MTSPGTPSRPGWLAPAALILLSVVPVTAGAALVVTLARGAHITPGNARFFAEPFPVVVQGLRQDPSVTNFRSA